MTIAQRIRPSSTSDIALSARGVVVLPVDDVAAPCHEAIVRSRCFGRMVRAVHVCAAGADHPELRRRWHADHPLVDLVIIDAGPGESPAAVIGDWVAMMGTIDDLLVVLADGSASRGTRAVSSELADAVENALVSTPTVLVARVHAR